MMINKTQIKSFKRLLHIETEAQFLLKQDFLILLLSYYDYYCNISDEPLIIGINIESGLLMLKPNLQNEKEQISQIEDYLNTHLNKHSNKKITLTFNDQIYINILLNYNKPKNIIVKAYNKKGELIKKFTSIYKLPNHNLNLSPIFRTKYYKCNLVKRNKNIITKVLVTFIKYLIINEEIRKRKDIKCNTKLLIEKTCECFLPILQSENIKLDFKTIDINLDFNSSIFCRIIFTILHQAIIYSSNNCKIEILSFIENQKFIVAFTPNTHKLCTPHISCPSIINQTLQETNSELAYQLNFKGETNFVFSTPYENIHS